MNSEELLMKWLLEESIAHIHGWDFSHINGRYDEENDLPWDYKSVIEKYLTPDKKILIMHRKYLRRMELSREEFIDFFWYQRNNIYYKTNLN